MADPVVKTKTIDRNLLTELTRNPELIKRLENLFSDVAVVLPEASGGSDATAAAALAAAQAAQITAGNASASADALALGVLGRRNVAPYINPDLFLPAAPSTGTWKATDKVWNSNPIVTGTAPNQTVIVGFLCVAGGSPGTWFDMTVGVAASVPTSDPYYANVSLLLHFDGTNGSTTFTDNSGTPKTMTAGGGAQITTTSPMFGTGALLLNGTNAYVTTPSSTAYDMGTGDFTIEGWINLVSNTSGWLVTRRNTTTPFAPFGILLNSGKIRFVYASGTGSYELDLTGTTTITTGTYHHIALVRSGTNMRVYLDGVAENGGTGIVSSMRTLAESLVFGAGAADGSTPLLSGRMDEWRITKGVARYTGLTFPVPAMPFPNS